MAEKTITRDDILIANIREHQAREKATELGQIWMDMRQERKKLVRLYLEQEPEGTEKREA